MRTLFVPLHLPLKVTLPMISRELKFREIVKIKRTKDSLIISHREMSLEYKAELLSCVEYLSDV